MTKKDKIHLLLLKIARVIAWVVCLFSMFMCLGESLNNTSMVLQFICLPIACILLVVLAMTELPVRIINGVKIYRKERG